MFSGFKSLYAPRRQPRRPKCSGAVNKDSPVHDIEAVQVLESAQKLGRIEPTPAFVKFALPLQMVEQLPSVDCKSGPRQSRAPS